jgi:hypothetical protein
MLDDVQLTQSGVLAHESIYSLYFETHVRHLKKKIGTKNSHVHLHVLHAHKVVS